MSERQAALTAAREAHAAEVARIEDARAEEHRLTAAAEALDPGDRKRLVRAIAERDEARGVAEVLAARAERARRAVVAAEEAIAAAEQAEVEAREDARRAAIEEVKRSVLAKLREAREHAIAAFVRLAQLGEPNEPLPGDVYIRWSGNDEGRDVVTIETARRGPQESRPDPTSAVGAEGYDRVRAAMGVFSRPRPEDEASKQALEVARASRRYEMEAERLSQSEVED